NELQAILTRPTLSTAEQRIDGLLLTAARNGIEFAMHTPAQAREIENEINSHPVVRKPVQMLRFN
ncbi:MAG: hypothetical protein WCJ42_12020, partial [Actinomycetes bacterium]